ncbi:hypothetical protein N7489_008071 [Penicillium chrysogenum]|uniref:Uncharacterized protein n=1 Tax=Penicillium chrysogenum TaxID=5076 RepID=A0ABQ8WAX7_PENCH|nr:uncharacterized protein N7489_008071 [Penicillium chrysogenum]XP_061071426.1 uncharacterized protein N7525_002159 [Penicillium rubens]KAJ5237980.1 hypothetical protein N7489_008071 [Penicillium chrysogenum]KAJ5261763.1 hypothetical protein N7505_008630 [Penicillium chrysogenum]KAJ5278279.1 hypothetical protein N7524_004432 [Penicillium chrysogenum]KAJ5844418.1 hypothetical protein N7525_002159 [Penicillium rubens]KAJ5844992.1 hypothetical protein N7534_008661 [Penicillium rubens]
MNSEYTSENRMLVPERKASTGARDRSRAIPSPQCLLLVYHTLCRFFVSAWSWILSSYLQETGSCCDPTAT